MFEFNYLDINNCGTLELLKKQISMICNWYIFFFIISEPHIINITQFQFYLLDIYQTIYTKKMLFTIFNTKVFFIFIF